MFWDYSPETTEPSQFKQFVGSFALLKPSTTSNYLVFGSLFVAILVVQIIPIWISVNAKDLEAIS